MNPDQRQPTHKQVAKQFECSLDSSYDELLRGIADKSYILQAPYGEFDRHDRELVLPARITRGLGQTASLGETLQKKARGHSSYFRNWRHARSARLCIF